MKIEISKEFLETCGQSSLQGLLAQHGIFQPQELTFQFKQSSYAWRAAHGGPELYLMPEFAPYYLMLSLLSLTQAGYKIHLELITI